MSGLCGAFSGFTIRRNGGCSPRTASAAPAHTAATAAEEAAAHGTHSGAPDGDRVTVQSQRFFGFSDDDRIGFSDFHLRTAQENGIETLRRGVTEDLIAIRIQYQDFRPAFNGFSEIIHNDRLFGTFIKVFRHHGAAGSDQTATADERFAAAFRTIVDGIIGSAAGKADPDRSAGDVEITVRVDAVGIPGILIDDGEAAAADAHPGLFVFFFSCCGRCFGCCFR